MMSFTGISQTLKPRIFVDGQDTLYCFTMPQCKHIAQHLEYGKQCNTVVIAMENEIDVLNKIGSTQSVTIKTLVSESDNKQQIISNQEKDIKKLEEEIQQKQKEIKRELWQKRILGAGIVTAAIISIIL